MNYELTEAGMTALRLEAENKRLRRQIVRTETWWIEQPGERRLSVTMDVDETGCVTFDYRTLADMLKYLGYTRGGADEKQT